MTESDHWQAQNDHYLETALAWLRQRLLHFREPETVSAESVIQAAAIRDAAELDGPPALMLLAQRFDLSRFEQEVLLLCAAVELDPGLPDLLAKAQNDPGRIFPTFLLALTLFDQPAWDVLSPERPLRYWRLVEIDQAGPRSLTASPLRADDRIVHYLKGLNYLDDRLTSLVSPLLGTGLEAELPPSQAAIAEAIRRQVAERAVPDRLPMIHLVGLDAPSKRSVATHAARGLGLHLYRLPVDLLPTQPGEMEAFARLWQRESWLLPLALYLDAHEADRSAVVEKAAALHRFAERTVGIRFLDTREPLAADGQPALVFDVAKPLPGEQCAAWETLLGPAADDHPLLLAGQFNLNLMAIRAIVRTVQQDQDTAAADRPLRDRLWEACLIHTRPLLNTLAQRLEPRARWEDLVLPAPELALLRQIASQVRRRAQVYDRWGFRARSSRGLGLSVLFVGESGTGKTMAAEVLAHELRLPLYRIDLSMVVNKFIGETEKNLRRVFDAAEDGGALLLFDEADALFGKRSHVKDSHDRYANIEINYLLQRMESYGGLAILATNQKSALDQAFLRRLRFLVQFPFPGPAERRLLWEHVFPSALPRAKLDLEQLAGLNLTGGSIQNVALNAAFLAAEAGTPVTQPLLLEAARAETRKLDRPLNEADFRWPSPAAGE